MKTITVPLNFTSTPTVFVTGKSFNSADVGSAELEFTTNIDVSNSVATLTLNNVTENANRKSFTIEKINVTGSPFSYMVEDEMLHAGSWTGEIIVTRNFIKIASALFTFGIENNLQAQNLEALIKSKSLDEVIDVMESKVDDFVGTLNTRVKINDNKIDAVILKTNEAVANVVRNEALRKIADVERKVGYDANDVKAQQFNGIVNEFNDIVDSFNTLNLTLGTDHVVSIADHATNVSDHNINVSDHSINVSDHGVNLSDHSVNDADHAINVSDHGINVSDHSIVAGYNGRLTTVETITAFMATNMLTNSGFDNGTTGWTIGTSNFNTNTVESGAYKISLTTNGYSIVKQPITLTASNKYYFCYQYKNTVAVTSFGNRFYENANTVASYDCAFTVHASYTYQSGIHTAVGNETHYAFRVGTTNASDIYYDNLTLLNLTAIFGVGNEPSVSMMDTIMSKFANRWFDGTANVFSGTQLINKQIALDNAKANKTQESWITPSLLNSWAPVDGTYTKAQYMKDEMGFVHLKGRLSSGTSTPMFTLPAGYRASGYMRFTTTSSGTTVLTIGTDASGSVFRSSGSATTDISLDGITFKAEA